MVLPKIITFSGLDGTGKTTLTQALKKHLEQKGLSVSICHIGATLSGPSEPGRSISGIVGFLIFLKDYLEVVFQYIGRVGKYDVVIFDRFLYDTLVKIMYKQGVSRIPRQYYSLVQLLFPIRHKGFLLQLSQATSFRRDKHHSKMYHAKKRSLYGQLSQFFNLIPIDGTRSSVEVFEEIKRHL